MMSIIIIGSGQGLLLFGGNDDYLSMNTINNNSNFSVVVEWKPTFHRQVWVQNFPVQREITKITFSQFTNSTPIVLPTVTFQNVVNKMMAKNPLKV